MSSALHRFGRMELESKLKTEQQKMEDRHRKDEAR
jgi:hypothetical protein